MSSAAQAPRIWPRFASVAIAAALGIPSVAAGVSAAIERVSPPLARSLYKGNVRALNSLAAVRMAQAPEIGADDRAAAQGLLRRSLASSLLNPTALRLMGIAVSPTLEGHQPRPWMQAATSVSHRDTAANIWLAQDAAQRGDANGAIAHVDHALRSSFSAAERLMPVLVAGLEDPIFQQRISELARAKVFWTGRFLQDAVYQSKRPDILADVVMASGGFAVGGAGSQSALLGRLVAEGYYDSALKFAGDMDQSARRVGRSVEISEQTTNQVIAPISWQINPDVASVLLLEDGRPGFVAQLTRGRRAVIANKLLYVPSPLRLRGSVTFAERSPGDALLVEASCPAASGTPYYPVGRPIAATTTEPQNWSVEISHPCNPVAIRLTSSGGLDGAGNELTVSGLAVTP